MAKVECELITQDAIDVEIGAGLGAVLQVKSVEINANGTSVVAPDDGFDGLESVEINTNVQKRFECGDAYFVPPKSGMTSFSINGLLQKIDVSCWDTSSVTNMASLFYNLSSIQSLDVSGWNVSNVTTMRYIFRLCTILENLDISGWDLSSVDDIRNAFDFCDKLVTLIGNKTISDVENGLKTMIGLKVNIATNNSPLRFSSILALANGLADLTGETAQTLTISSGSYSNMYNDDDTVPTADVIAERRARIAAICASKNWNFAH